MLFRSGDPWQVYTFLNVARVPDLAQVKGYATALTHDVAMTSTDFKSYDPENLSTTIAERPLTLSANLAFPSQFLSRGARAVDFNATTSWSVSKAESALISWISFDLNGSYNLRRIDLDFCEGTEDKFEIVATQKESSLRSEEHTSELLSH